MTWLVAQRRQFDGATDIDTCLDRDACTRPILVHGLGLRLEIERSMIDALMPGLMARHDKLPASHQAPSAGRPRFLANFAKSEAGLTDHVEKITK